jgi:hypothetical protein
VWNIILQEKRRQEGDDSFCSQATTPRRREDEAASDAGTNKGKDGGSRSETRVAAPAEHDCQDSSAIPWPQQQSVAFGNASSKHNARLQAGLSLNIGPSNIPDDDAVLRLNHQQAHAISPPRAHDNDTAIKAALSVPISPHVKVLSASFHASPPDRFRGLVSSRFEKVKTWFAGQFKGTSPKARRNPRTRRPSVREEIEEALWGSQPNSTPGERCYVSSGNVTMF